MGKIISNKSSGNGWFDLAIIIVLAMVWFLLVQVWANPLVITMFAFTISLIPIYLLVLFTGFLNYMKLSYPIWTGTFAIGLLVWTILLPVIPSGFETSSLDVSLEEGIISKLLPHEFIVRISNIYLFPITESLMIALVFALFYRIASKRKGEINNYRNKNAISPLFIVAGFGSVIHTAVAYGLQKSKVITFTISLWQQFLSFFIFMAFGIFFGAVALMTTHIAKNILVLGNGIWIFWTFIAFILIDILIIASSGKSENIIKDYVSEFKQ